MYLVSPREAAKSQMTVANIETQTPERHGNGTAGARSGGEGTLSIRAVKNICMCLCDSGSWFYSIPPWGQGIVNIP